MELLALMGSANWVPICLSGYDASDIRRVVPVPGLTGVAITSRRSHNLMEPFDRLELFSALKNCLLDDLTPPGLGHGELDRSRRAS